MLYHTRMTGTICKEIELAGMWVEVSADFSADWVNNGIGAYEFWGARGVHNAWEWEVQSVDGLVIVGDLFAIGLDWAKTNYPRLSVLWPIFATVKAKQALREFAQLDADDVFTDDELTDAACDQGGDEGDCGPDPDRERDDLD